MPTGLLDIHLFALAHLSVGFVRLENKTQSSSIWKSG